MDINSLEVGDLVSDVFLVADAKLGVDKDIRVIERPVSLLSLHVVVAKTHPRARTYLHYINSSLDRLRDQGTYDKIVDEHLSRFWSAQPGS